MRTRGWAVALAALLAGAGPAAAQTDTTAASAALLVDRVAALSEQVLAIQSEADKRRRFKFSGYVQARWESSEQKSDSVRVTGSPPVVTPANTERFLVRRARIKLTYDSSPLSQAVIMFDGSSSGSSINARLLDAYVTLFDPWTALHQHSLTAGQMNVPFGYEIERSSAAREMLERSRAENVLFPGERDRGVKLTSLWTPRLETVLGMFNGGQIGDANFPTTDPTRAKDLLARVRYMQGTVDGGLSFMSGEAVTPLTGADVRTTRRRFGLDGQVYYQLPAAGGGTLRGELYAGHDVNADSVRALTVAAGGDAGTLIRPGADRDHFATDVLGWYVMWVQNWGDWWQFAARYDIYDPNTDLDHDQYERWGFALHYFHDGWTRLTAAYDIPRTERLVGTRWDDPHDNLFTLQLQLRF